MKKSVCSTAFLLIALPTAALFLLLILFTQPKPELTMTNLFRAEDFDLPLQGFQCTIVDNVLTDCNYSVKIGENSFVWVYYPLAGEAPVVQDFSSESRVLSALTLGQMKELIAPVWAVLAEKYPEDSAITLLLGSPQSVNESLLTQRKTNMTLSVSTGVLTKVTETYLGTTDYGMITANLTYKNTYASDTLYVMLIP